MLERVGAVISKNRRFIPITATALLAFVAYGVGAIFIKGMREPQVFLNIFRANSFILLSAVGMTFVILSKGIDLSVAGVMALTATAAAALLRDGWNAWLVILLMLVMGMTLGAIMGSFIAYMKVQPFIATLAGLWFARGMCFFISDDAIAIHNREFTILGQTKLLIPGWAELAALQGNAAPYITIPVAVGLVVLVAAIYIAHYTRFGRTVYAVGGNEQSARLMGLPVNPTLVLVYTFSGFCSALAGLSLSMFVSSGHGLYAPGFELDVIASVVMGGTMLSGGSGYVLGTLFGVLILGITQTLIQFIGTLSSWWTRIVIGLLTFMFIGVQSILAARKGGRRKPVGASVSASNRRRLLLFGSSTIGVLVILGFIFIPQIASQNTITSTADSGECELKPFRPEQAALLIADGAVITWETNGGPRCIDELYAVFPDGRVTGDNGETLVEQQVPPAEVEKVLARISESYGWFTDEMYSTWHTPCGQCYAHYITVSFNGLEKTVTGVDGGVDMPPEYGYTVSLIKTILPKFTPAP